MRLACRESTDNARTRPACARVSPAATSVLEWIVNWQRVIPHKTICAIGATMTAAKHRLHLLRSRAAASWGADSARIKVVWQSLYDVGRRRNQYAVPIEPERQGVRAIAVSQRVSRIDHRRFIKTKLTNQMRIGRHDVVAIMRA